MVENESYRIGVWDDGALASLALRLADAGRRVGIEVERLPRPECNRRLRAGMLDAALVPAVDVLSDTESYDVYPLVAISAWRAPHASIHLPDGLGEKPRTVSCSAEMKQEQLMARIVLREHYGMQPEMSEAAPGEEAGEAVDGSLRVGEIVPEAASGFGAVDQEGGITLDLGQEWFELTSYPMVWGLFVSRRGEAEDRTTVLLLEAAAGEQPLDDTRDSVSDVIADSQLRFRLDDVATASLTELADLLFFYRVTEDVPELHFTSVPEPDGEDESDSES